MKLTASIPTSPISALTMPPRVARNCRIMPTITTVEMKCGA